jgi:signal transduction histidine kinase
MSTPHFDDLRPALLARLRAWGEADSGAPADLAAAAAERWRFLATLSHGIRTPLHNIFGYAQLLEAGIRGPLTDIQRDDIGRIRENERHLLNLVDAVINFAQWESSDWPALDDVVVRDALDRTNESIARLAAAKGVRYDVRHAAVAADVTVRADQSRLTEILIQLLQNAVKFSRPGDSVDVRAILVGACVWIRVSDTGTGIAPEDIKLIFHPLVRGRDAYARAQDGVGLGLAITRKLAQSMHGELSVISKVGEGSTFTLELPRGRQAIDSLPREARTSP